MPTLKKILRYRKHYGTKATVGLIHEKLIVDPKRFSLQKARKLPSFPTKYNAYEIKAAPLKKKSLNILYPIHYFYPTKRGGTERFTLNLVKEQIKLGNSPTVLVLDANEPLSSYTEQFGNILYRYYEYDGVRCIAIRHIRAPLGLYYKSVRLDDEDLRAFAHHITDELSVDIVHATYPQPFASFLDECRNIGIPYVVTCTDFCMMCHYSSLVDKNGDFCVSTEGGERCAKVCKTYGCKDFKKRLKNAEAVLLGASAVTVPSAFVAKILSAEFPSVKFLVVAHGIAESFEYKKRFGSPKRFVYAGTLSPLKGVHLLINAFKKIDGEISLDIYGEGDVTYIKKLTAAADSRVRFKGAAPGDKMPEIYAAVDCVIVPSMWYETYNFVLREALKTGALVLASNIGAMPEAVTEGKNGYLFTPSDELSLKEKIEEALSFDFENYEQGSFPTLADEGKVYQQIYQSLNL